jgi:hypothetical protein
VRRILSWENGKAEADQPLETKRRIGIRRTQSVIGNVAKQSQDLTGQHKN